jgi:hypothetical protein
VSRPTDYTPELGDEICDGLTLGKSLLKICEDERMPVTRTVYRWLREHEEFSHNYTRARENQADTYADEIVDISDEAVDRDSAAAAKVRVEARKWVASKLKPKKYSDKLDIDATVDGKLTVNIVNYDDNTTP